ncbi:hypothetical protein, partial [Endobacter medicaginis]|uniref:hypothetical protein n=1 Tax=Endobacter medicaginis TaxID=1181271 RepID=UPI001C85570D
CSVGVATHAFSVMSCVAIATSISSVVIDILPLNVDASAGRRAAGQGRAERAGLQAFTLAAPRASRQRIFLS